MALSRPSHVTTVAQMTHEQLVEIAKVRALARSGAARSIRLAAGLSLSETAAPIHVSPTTVYRWEVGQRSPRGEAALRYADLLRSLMGAGR